jgi:peptidyl-tRNA hydrolase, PTH1 family
VKLLVGLGNPGRKYEGTRHNIGFQVARAFAAKFGSGSVKQRFEGETIEVFCGSSRGLVLCPSTYMNASGRSVRQAVDFYRIERSEVLVLSDDWNLPVGRLRARPAGSAGGQKGLADILRTLGAEEVPRLRIGIGTPPPQWDKADYVLGKFTDTEQPTVLASVDRACQAIECWMTHGIEQCMNQFNSGDSARGSQDL